MMPGKKMGKMLAQAQKAQEKMQQEIAALRMDGTAGGGVVKATVDGEKALLDLEIDPSVLEDGDATMVADLVLAAVSDAQGKIDGEVQKKMQSLAGSLGLPPGMGL